MRVWGSRLMAPTNPRRGVLACARGPQRRPGRGDGSALTEFCSQKVGVSFGSVVGKRGAGG